LLPRNRNRHQETKDVCVTVLPLLTDSELDEASEEGDEEGSDKAADEGAGEAADAANDGPATDDGPSWRAGVACQ
jgi:hypothetical protein